MRGRTFQGVVVSGAKFVWDAKLGALVYDGTDDPDPRWKWNQAKGGYEPSDDIPGEVFDRRIGQWIGAQGGPH